MNTQSWKWTAALAAMAINLAAGPVAAARPAAAIQPPMNSFDFAYYNCDKGMAFQVTYDSNTPRSATMTTSNNNKQYALTRQPVDDGAQFGGGAVKFWTDGKTVRVDGTSHPMENCKLQAN